MAKRPVKQAPRPEPSRRYGAPPKPGDEPQGVEVFDDLKEL